MTLPAIFLGHGSPMNAIDPASRYNRAFLQTAAAIAKPQAILMVSAHWIGRDLRIMSGVHNPISTTSTASPPHSTKPNTPHRERRNSPRASANCWQDTRCTPTPTAAWTTALGRCYATSIPKPTYRSSNLG